MKYKSMHLGTNNNNFSYKMGAYRLETTEEERDLAVLADYRFDLEQPV